MEEAERLSREEVAVKSWDGGWAANRRGGDEMEGAGKNET